ncbi:MAG: 4Fe-4S dicluster domain-containing protein, partial [Candidatus Zixiibacteriota bacterium]
VSDENIYEGIRLATGETRQPIYSYDKAKVILSLDSDFLRLEIDDIPAARGFADGRRVETQKDDMNRLYVIESTLSVTGTNADHRLPVASHDIGGFALRLLKELRNQGLAVMPGVEFDDGSLPEFDSKWIQALARDLIRVKGSGLVVAGRRQPAAVHAIVYAINDALGNVGNTINYHELRDVAIPGRKDLADLVNQMNRGSIETLLILNTNPVYTAPEDLQFGDALKKVKHSVELAPYVAETTPMVEWHIPMAHFLESWGDTRATDGTRSVIQPLIEPLFNGRSMIEVLGLVTSGRDLRGYDIVRETWKDIIGGGDFESKWRKVLHDGLLTEKLPSASNPKAKSRPTTALTSEITSLTKSRPEGMEIVFVPGDLYDGRYANNGWLMELADPITKLTWDNPAMISYKAAKSLGLKSGDMVKIEFDGRSLTMPVWVTPGQAENTVTLVLGYGRDLDGRVADGAGFDTYRLRTMKAFDFGSGASLTKTGESYELANTQEHGSMEGRPIVREATLAEYKKEAEFYPEQIEHPPLLPLWTPHSYAEGYQWGMTIDLNACIGCGACTVACQSENNIPIVGKQHVAEGREMQWIRVDRYYASDTDKPEGAHENPEVLHQPVPCQQCENAPCESVCPVAATVHDREGLNVMVYNRCIGTRYCSNNCPYKVRRFNFFNYTSKTPEVEKMSKNPEVTVRSRGVMEKCTYCVQRIVKAKDHAKLEGREVQDGEIVTACQQVCPAQAIVFGNINDPDSKVAKMKKLDRSYNLLEELNTKPRTSYLAKLRNPNPELAGKRRG